MQRRKGGRKEEREQERKGGVPRIRSLWRIVRSICHERIEDYDEGYVAKDDEQLGIEDHHKTSPS